MRTAAEVGELPGAINRNPFIGLGELFDEMALHEVAFLLERRQSLFARQELASIRDVLLDQFLHLLLELFEVFRSKWSRPVKVVKESAFGGRAVSQLGFRKQFEDRCSQ